MFGHERCYEEDWLALKAESCYYVECDGEVDEMIKKVILYLLLR